MIKLVNVSKFYSSNNVIALGLRKVNMELHLNEFVAIVGESGSGKTTLLNVISGIDSYEDGEMYINGKETSYYSVADMENYRKKYVAFVFQNYNLIDSYTVLQNVEAPLILSGYPYHKVRSRALEIIEKVGLTDHINHKATKLSGGQKQRVVIARALAKDCPIIAADEPTGNLDSVSAKQIIQLLHEIAKEKLVIVVTHDFEQVAEYATRKIRIFDGEVVEDRNIKKVEKKDLPEMPDENHKIRFLDYLKISLRNLLAVPKKSILMVIVFAFFSFFVAFSYGAYQIVSQETTYNYNFYFENSNPNRIVVRNLDASALTDDQLSDLADYGVVDEVVPFDYILDINISMETMDAYDYRNYFSGNYLPLSMIQESDLKYGEMPAADNEVVISINDNEVDYYSDALPMTVYSSKYGDTLSYKIVGIIENSTLILSDQSQYTNYFLVTDNQLSNLQKSAYFQYILNFSATDDAGEIYFDNSNLMVSIDNTLADHQIAISSYAANKACDASSCTYDVNFDIQDYYINRTFEDWELLVSETYYYTNYLYMNQDTFDELTYDAVYQVSLLTSSQTGATTLVNTLKHVNDTAFLRQYKVVYPYDSEPLQTDEGLYMLLANIGMIVLNAVVILGSTLITYVIFRVIINTKLHDYSVFRTIGANQTVIKIFIYLENLFIVLVAYIIFVAISLNISNNVNDFGLFYFLTVFNFGSYIVFFFLLILMSLIISRKYSNRIFRDTVQTTLKASME